MDGIRRRASPLQGEEGEVFFFIESGSVICKNLPGEQSNNILHAVSQYAHERVVISRTFAQGDYFGERALLKREPRVADVYAETDVSLIALHKEDFENLLSHLRDLLEYNLGMSPFTTFRLSLIR
jgi:CRP-like cAMP-binding protein